DQAGEPVPGAGARATVRGGGTFLRPPRQRVTGDDQPAGVVVAGGEAAGVHLTAHRVAADTEQLGGLADPIVRHDHDHTGASASRDHRFGRIRCRASPPGTARTARRPTPAQTTVCSTDRYRKHRPMRCRYRFVLQTVGQPPVSPSAGWAPRVSVAPMQITSDTVALISGGASGLGEATARRMIAAGGAVVLLDLPTSPGQDLADDLGERAVFVAGDVRDEGSVRGAVEAATSLGTLRIAVSCAGVATPGRILGKRGL